MNKQTQEALNGKKFDTKLQQYISFLRKYYD
jgi:hypothetical protein